MNDFLILFEYRRALSLLLNRVQLDDNEVLQVPHMFNRWFAPRRYGANQIVSFGENDRGKPELYRAARAHNSVEGSPPDVPTNPRNWERIGYTNQGVPFWVRPLSDEDGYAEGYVVSHNGRNYTSELDGNIFEPGVSGWR